MATSLIDEYARILASLEGNEFQAEVSARLGTVILSFQPVPSHPHGDAGLDGYSHGGELGYCCYGPEHQAHKQNRSRETAIVKKFTGDLRWLLELEVKQGQLVHVVNVELKTILRDRQRLKHITLIANWFESHRVLGPLQTKFAEYKAASSCTFVEPDATLNVLGPKELANRYAVDELTIGRAQQRDFVRKVQATAEEITIENPKGFEYKMQLLREIRPDQIPAIDGLSETFRANWRTALAFEHELDESVPNLRRVLETDRQEILTRVAALMVGTAQPWTQLERAGQIADEILRRNFGRLYNELVPPVSFGEIARLIGECPIGWEPPVVHD